MQASRCPSSTFGDQPPGGTDVSRQVLGCPGKPVEVTSMCWAGASQRWHPCSRLPHQGPGGRPPHTPARRPGLPHRSPWTRSQPEHIALGWGCPGHLHNGSSSGQAVQGTCSRLAGIHGARHRLASSPGRAEVEVHQPIRCPSAWFGSAPTCRPGRSHDPHRARQAAAGSAQLAEGRAQ